MSAKPGLATKIIWTAAGLIVLLLIGGAILGSIGRVSTGREGWDRTRTEVASICSAIENYKIDNGKYPSDPDTTERLRPGADFDPQAYVAASEFLYRALSGDSDGVSNSSNPGKSMSYFSFQQNQIRTGESGHKYIVDPWGNSYGYSTFKAVHPGSNAGNNPTFDFWSTRNGKSSADQPKWTKNW